MDHLWWPGITGVVSSSPINFSESSLLAVYHDVIVIFQDMLYQQLFYILTESRQTNHYCPFATYIIIDSTVTAQCFM